MHRNMRALLDDLDYDFGQFRLRTFARWMEERRGRNIIFVSYAMPPDLFGAWIRGRDTDYIFFEKNTPRMHQVHIQLHEMAHILLGHPTLEVDQPNPADSASQTLLLRSVHSSEQDQEAEMLAALIQERIHHLNKKKIGRYWVTTPADIDDYIVSRKPTGRFREDIQVDDS